MDEQKNRASPMTGDAYLDSLRDGREVWIYGERVEDVTTHPGFRNAARMSNGGKRTSCKDSPEEVIGYGQ